MERRREFSPILEFGYDSAVPDSKHKNRDVYLVLVTALFSIFILPWLTLWTVKESTPTAHIHVW